MFNIIALLLAVSASMYRWFPDKLDVGVDIEDIGNEDSILEHRISKITSPTNRSISKSFALPSPLEAH